MCISAQELYDFLKHHTYRNIVFSSENQDDFRVKDPLSMSLEFSSILMSLNPSRIVLKGDCGTVTLKMVDSAETECGSVLGDIVTVVCGYSSGSSRSRLKIILQ